MKTVSTAGNGLWSLNYSESNSHRKRHARVITCNLWGVLKSGGWNNARFVLSLIHGLGQVRDTRVMTTTATPARLLAPVPLLTAPAPEDAPSYTPTISLPHQNEYRAVVFWNSRLRSRFGVTVYERVCGPAKCSSMNSQKYHAFFNHFTRKTYRVLSHNPKN